MTNPTMIEHVAQALFEAKPHNHPDGLVPQWQDQPGHIRGPFEREARAAIRALREPTLGMIEAFRLEGGIPIAWDSLSIYDEDLRDGWQAAIDAALAEPGPD